MCIILTFNLEYGGYYLYKKNNSFSYINKYIDIIKKYNVDAVCFQEAFFIHAKDKRPFDITKEIAEKLGFYHKNNSFAYLSIISKYPLTKISNSKHNFLTCSFEKEEKTYTITNIHLSNLPNTYYTLINFTHSDTYTKEKELNYKKAAELSYETKQRDIEKLMDLLKYKKTPLIICGDFNELSHLDRGIYEKDIEWKTSKHLYSKGFIDIVRHFDTKNPYYSCDVIRKESKYNPPMRIDMVYFKNIKPIKFKYLNKYNNGKMNLSDHVPILAYFE